MPRLSQNRAGAKMSATIMVHDADLYSAMSLISWLFYAMRATFDEIIYYAFAGWLPQELNTLAPIHTGGQLFIKEISHAPSRSHELLLSSLLQIAYASLPRARHIRMMRDEQSKSITSKLSRRMIGDLMLYILMLSNGAPHTAPYSPSLLRRRHLFRTHCWRFQPPRFIDRALYIFACGREIEEPFITLGADKGIKAAEEERLYYYYVAEHSQRLLPSERVPVFDGARAFGFQGFSPAKVRRRGAPAAAAAFGSAVLFRFRYYDGAERACWRAAAPAKRRRLAALPVAALIERWIRRLLLLVVRCR